MKKICFVGLGYIGLPTALIAASFHSKKIKYQVYGYDIDAKKVAKINKGISPIIEPGLQKLLSQVHATKSFIATTNLTSADYFIITVPTPFTTRKKADLSYVRQAGKAICSKLQPGNTIILESTVPVGTTKKLASLIEKTTQLKAGKDFYVAYCPERVLPGKIIHELIHNDRVIGGINKVSTKKAKNFYAHFVKGNCFLTDSSTAEMVKLVENSSRDIQIALANQIAHMCEKAHINPFNVIKLANKHPRVNLLQPGCGVGGHCIAVDPWFLINSFPHASSLLKTARTINDDKPHMLIKQIITTAKKWLKKNNRPAKVLVLGLTFKPNIDDLRQSPALLIAQALNKQKKFLHLTVFDPFIKKELCRTLGLATTDELPQAIQHADIIAILVKHSLFYKKLLEENFIVSTKTIFDPCGLFCQEIHETTFSKKRNSKNFICSTPTPHP